MPVSMSMQKSNFGSIYIYIYIVPLVLETSFFLFKILFYFFIFQPLNLRDEIESR